MFYCHYNKLQSKSSPLTQYKQVPQQVEIYLLMYVCWCVYFFPIIQIEMNISTTVKIGFIQTFIKNVMNMLDFTSQAIWGHRETKLKSVKTPVLSKVLKKIWWESISKIHINKHDPFSSCLSQYLEFQRFQECSDLFFIYSAFQQFMQIRKFTIIIKIMIGKS